MSNSINNLIIKNLYQAIKEAITISRKDVAICKRPRNTKDSYIEITTETDWTVISIYQASITIVSRKSKVLFDLHDPDYEQQVVEHILMLHPLPILPHQ